MRKLKNKKVVFFDMGNTLLYFHNSKKKEKQAEELGVEYLYQFLKEQVPQITKEALVEGFITPWRSALNKRKESFKEVKIDELLNNFLKQYDSYLSYPMCVNAFRVFYYPFMELVEVGKDTYDTLKTLKDHGYIIAVIANTPYFSEVMKECFELMGLGECIDNYFFSYDIEVMKPKKDIFEYALKRLEVNANECVMVGDSLYHDMASAVNLGMDGIWLNTKEEDNYLDVSLLREINQLSTILDSLLEAEQGDTLFEDDMADEEEEDYSLNASDFLEDEDDFDISSYIDED